MRLGAMPDEVTLVIAFGVIGIAVIIIGADLLGLSFRSGRRRRG